MYEIESSEAFFIDALNSPSKPNVIVFPLLSAQVPINGLGEAQPNKIQAKRIVNKKKMLNKKLASLTNQDIKIIEQDTERDKYLSSKEALEYGIIDKII